jgi:hypothetical protein
MVWRCGRIQLQMPRAPRRLIELTQSAESQFPAGLAGSTACRFAPDFVGAG